MSYPTITPRRFQPASVTHQDEPLFDGRCATCSEGCRKEDDLFICEGCGQKHCGECAKVITDDGLRMCSACRICKHEGEAHEAHNLCSDCGDPICHEHGTRVYAKDDPEDLKEFEIICAGCVEDRAKVRKSMTSAEVIHGLECSIEQARRRA